MGLNPENLDPLNLRENKLLKGFIAVAMLGAIMLPLYKLYIVSHDGVLPSRLDTLVTVTYFVLMAHVIEGLIAGAIAFRRGENVIKAGVYAFFTGFIGLTEIINSEA
ncbi:MAG: hypothetical protein AAGD25_07190 [Cyanobacteria bacterium P01_F01_bin.150]